MRELKRKLRVARMRGKHDKLARFCIAVIVLHIGFVLGYLTIAILNQ